MKKIFYLASLMLVVTFSTTIYSCSSDDDESKDINYTTDEIVQILTGKWAIKGFCKAEYDYDMNLWGEYVHYHEIIDTTYTGEIEFLDNMKYKSNTSEIYQNQGLYYFIGNNNSSKYTVLKKNGDTYISFPEGSGSRSSLDMKVLYLNKNKFKFVYDGPHGYKDQGHLYLTIESN